MHGWLQSINRPSILPNYSGEAGLYVGAGAIPPNLSLAPNIMVTAAGCIQGTFLQGRSGSFSNFQCSNCEKRGGGLNSSGEGTRFEAP